MKISQSLKNRAIKIKNHFKLESDSEAIGICLDDMLESISINKKSVGRFMNDDKLDGSCETTMGISVNLNLKSTIELIAKEKGLSAGAFSRRLLIDGVRRLADKDNG